MSTELSPREESILKVIKEAISQKGYPPSVREIGVKIGVKSSSTVHTYLRRLEEKKMIRRDSSKPRAIEVINKEPGEEPPKCSWIPVVGRVAAGMPLQAIENPEGYFPLPHDFAGDGEYFMLTVKGESMIDAGIYPGDLVIVKRQEYAENGEIVVALIEDEATVKRFFKEKDHVKLKPENTEMEPIISREASIIGKVTGLYRQI